MVCASSRPVGSCTGWSADTPASFCSSGIGCHITIRDPEAPTGQQLGNIRADRRGHENLLSCPHSGSQALPPDGVQLRKYVVEYQHWLYPIGPKQVEAA